MPSSIPRTLRGDPIRLRQALLNLISNALKFTAAGEINIRIDAVTETDSSVTLRFAVKDSGVGIPVEAQQRIFEAFSQADGTTTRRFGGTGLGLTIVKELVALMQGRIGVESQVGQGSTFGLPPSLSDSLQPPKTTTRNMHCSSDGFWSSMTPPPIARS